MTNAFKKKSEEFKSNYYSLNESDRHRALENLANENTPDATRELVHIFHNSQWRETKLFIIKNIVKCSNQRSFEFLIGLTSCHQDIPLAEQAIKSLGLLGNDFSRKFLVQYYRHGSEHLKPAVILALAEARDRSLVLQFVTDLDEAYTNQRQYLAKNLIYALGELKCREAVKTLTYIVESSGFKDLALSALIALGKITRDLGDISAFEKKFSTDTFEYQIYQNVKNQVVLRSNWKAEDYLQKIFEEKSYHPAMPLELNTFSEQDVRAGLDLFVQPDKQKQLFDVLSKLSFSNTSNWYKEFASSFACLNFDLLCHSLSYQHSDSYLDLVNSKKDIQNENWFHLVISSLPSADKVFADIFKSEQYHLGEPELKINVINQFLNWAMVYRLEDRKIKYFEKQIEALLFDEKDIHVQTRLIRALGQMSLNSPKVNAFIKQNSFKKELISSCLFYLEHSQKSDSVDLLEAYLDNELVNSHFAVQILKAFTAQGSQIIKNKKIETFIELTAKNNKNPEVHKTLVQFLIKHPFAGLKNFVVSSLKHEDPEVQLNSVIALKSYQDEKLADDVQTLLHSKIESISGRALDTLLSLPGLRAKRLVFDYLIEQIEKPTVVEQICRRFESPENSTDYFYKHINDVVNKHPNHPQIEVLTEFKEKLFVNLETEKLSKNEKDSEVLAIDLDLSKKIALYSQCDETAKSALRSAELPFVHPEMYSTYVDKSASILGYSKALDIILEKQIGRKLLFPKLESRLHEFQNIIHLYELNDSNPSFERVIKNLSLEKHFNQQSLPLHKMSLVGQGILNSKIINEHFKILDGLRAWAVILLLFGRKNNLVQKPLIQVADDDNLIITLSKKLMWLQDLRNPVAHRQTLSDFKAVEQARAEVIDILNSLNKLLKNP
ncbi:hypothetical protein K2P97_10535 [bacterium]|nr:hypothetical protein [bacterium]